MKSKYMYLNNFERDHERILPNSTRLVQEEHVFVDEGRSTRAHNEHDVLMLAKMKKGKS